ncbi:RHS repeat-associated core domain-containing protein [Streptomyces sedi]|uniref:Type IV secretion protein Rhs n=1 Tax=Streptomyces sedi TaxID=555059 RepID=A0A5C4V3J8_9ACTN|nr:RHS repeat-associated core domain-containing protein [Streptomyces sedi]TNM30562.1 hypothetical protein FH715_11170 [Streptomyces sedi]
MDRDPTPGDPDEVRELADELREFADDVDEALGKIRGLASERAVLDWAGLSADVFRAEFDGVPGNLTKLEESYSLCSQALGTYWPKLQTAQGMADRALDRAISAQADLASAQSALGDAEDWMGRAGEEAERLRREGEREDVEPPDEDDVRAATRDAQAAEAAAGAARSRVNDAEERLSAARQLAQEAQEMREDAARECSRDIDEASDAGIQNRRWWEKAIDWVTDNWDTFVEACKVIVAVLGVVVMIIGGPLAWVVLAAALVVLADTLIKFARGEAGLLDVAFAAFDCIPGMKGLTTLGGLAAGLRGLARTGLRGMARGAVGAGRRLRGSAVEWGRRVFSRDPVDFATGEVAWPATDVDLPGVLSLVLRRHHLSTYREGRWFGPSWASTLDQRLVLEEHGVALLTEDGMRLEYPIPLPEPEQEVMPVEGPRWGLSWDGERGTPIAVHRQETGRTLHFAPVPGHRGSELPLVAISDSNTNRIDIRYSEHGQPTEIVHSGGYRVGVGIVDGRVTALRLLSDDVEPVLLAYEYDTAGNLAKVYNSSGLPMLFSYDEEHRLTRWEDRNGTWYRYEYDEAGRCVFGTGTDRALECSYAYDTENHRTTATDSLGHVTVYQFNDCFQLVAETDPAGNTTRRAFDRYDRVTVLTDPLGRTTRCDHDESGQVTVVVRPDSTRTRAQYNDLGLLSEIINPDGTTWRYAYDSRGNRTTVTDPAGNRTRYTHFPTGAVSSITDALGNVTHFGCDAAGLPVTVSDAGGGTSRYGRDAFGRPVEIVDPLGAVTTFAWSVEGDPLRRTAPDGGRREWRWDGESNLLAFTDENGGVTRFTYGPFDLAASQTTPDGATLRYVRDTELNIVQMVSPTGLTWDYTYDQVGRMTTESDFDDRTTHFELDGAGQLLSRTNAAGERLSLSHDAMGRVVRRVLSTGETTSFAYDWAGQLVHAHGPDAEMTRSHDLSGRLLWETVNGRTLTLDYDGLGRLLTRRTPGGHASSWSYAEGGGVSALTSGAHHLAFERDALGRESLRAVDDTFVLRHCWNEAGLPAEQVLTVPDGPAGGRRELHRRSYAYRPDGYLTAVSEGSDTTHYTVGPAGHVLAVAGPGGEETYVYDLAGNQTNAHRTSFGHMGEETGQRDYAGSLLTQAGAVRYTYDAAGRVIRRQRKRLSRKPDIWHYTWNAENQLTGVVTPDGTRWRYSYDPLGRRIAKTRLAADGATVVERVLFTWHGNALVEQMAVADDEAARITTWDHHGLHPLTQTERVHGAREAEQGEIDERFFAIVTDLVGTPTHLIDEGGGIAWQRRATLWGRTVTEGADGAHTALRFPGQYADEETGWHFNHHRHYDPETGRFSTPDPYGLLPAPNPYTYPHNPHTWIDPLGLAYTNAHLADLPIHSNPERFYVRAGELVDNRVPSHGLNDAQMLGGEIAGHGGVRNLSNDELIRIGGPQGNDPISGYRDWGPGDSINYPGSQVHITGGHHRTAEIAERVGRGEMTPDVLIEFLIRE